MNPRTERDLNGLLERVRTLEQTVAELTAGGAAKPASQSVQASREADRKEEAEPVREEQISEAVYEDLGQLKKRWKEIVRACGGAAAGFLEGTYPTYRNDIGFIIPFENIFYMKQIESPERMELLKQTAAKALGKEFHFKLMLSEQLDPNVHLVKGDGASSHEGIGIEMGEQ